MTTQHTCSQPCNLCGSRDIDIIGTMNRDGKPLRSVICKQCGLVWSDPFPHNPRHFYEDAYRVVYKGNYTPKPKHILRAGRVALSRLAKMQSLLSQPKTILDVGTGGGEFAYLLQTHGHQISGIEPNIGYAEYSIKEYGLNVQQGFIQECQFAQNSFDIITIWHVLEHTENPFQVLTKLHDLLKDNGVLIVEVPTIEAVCQAPKNTFHDAHLFNFNQRTLMKLGEKVGFTQMNNLLSEDGANITLFFQKSERKLSESECVMPDNAQMIMRCVKEHTPIKHYLTAIPYQRFVKKLLQMQNEFIETRNFKDGKTLLNTLYRT